MQNSGRCSALQRITAIRFIFRRLVRFAERWLTYAKIGFHSKTIPERQFPSMGEPATYTAREFADRLSLKRQTVQVLLGQAKPTRLKVVAGQTATAWSLADVPISFRERLELKAAKDGYRDAEAMMTSQLKQWQPALPLNEIADAEIARAEKLRSALLPSFARLHDTTLSAAEFEQVGIEDYRRAFGHTISARHFRSLMKRTRDRDRGAENWNRLEIYLPENSQPRRAPARSPVEPVTQFQRIADFINLCKNAACPDETELQAIWIATFDQYDEMVRQGIAPKTAARRLRDFLFTRAPGLARSRNGLRMAFERKLSRWQQSSGGANALRDGRKDNGEEFKLPEDDRDALIHRAVFYYRGQVAPAWRDLLGEGFSDSVRTRYSQAQDKSHVPESIMDSVRTEVETLTVMLQGPKAFDAIKGYVTRSYDGITSLACMSADDFTLNSYFYVPDGKGWFSVTRGQTILFHDFRSLRILGWALEPRGSYSSLTIRSLCTHVFDEFGVPQTLLFERGLWRSATLLKGKSEPFGFEEISVGLREFGVKFIHAIRPRTKTIERIGGLFQDLAEAEPGYCGRDERHDAPELLRKQIAKVNSRQVHPSKFFYSFEQWNHRIGQLCELYNSTPQQGHILRGLSPNEAFEKFLDPNNPTMKFNAQLRYLLAHDKRQVCVTLNGVTIQVGKQKFNYRGREIAHLVGRDALAWFDPENPETLVITTLDRQNPVCVSRSQEPSALEAEINPGAGILARELGRIEDQASYMKTRFNVLRTKFELPQRRLLADAQTIELGAKIEMQKARASESNNRYQKQLSQARSLARDTGIVAAPEALQREDISDDAKVLRSFLNPTEAQE